MDKRTRVLNALQKKTVDHVPVGFWYHFSGENAMGDPCVQAHVDYYESTDLDFIKIMCDGYFPYPVPKTIQKASDWYQLQPLGKDHPFIREQVERAAKIVALKGKEMCVFYNVFAPFSSLRFGVDDETIMRHLKEDRLAVMHALDVIAQDNALLSQLLITEAGCDGVYYCVQGGEYGRMSMEEYQSTIKPSDLYVLEHANRYSQYNIMHCCGWSGQKNQLALWKDYPCRAINWAVHVEGLSLEEGREFFGNKTELGGFETLWNGSFHQGIIYTGGKEEILEYTRNMILNHGKTGLMLGGDCTLDASVDHERIRWVVQAARSV
ncbi:MAG: uroporphyrinogen decarboxylase family protein [Eubacteriales bacterium]|nr:uroporphyrinogen decarboxylase family protein [Eubacteriales bacterium]